MIRITAKQDGFRRCGVTHSKTATSYPNDHFSSNELEIMGTEPQLVVEILDDDGEPINVVPTDNGPAVDVDELLARIDELQQRKLELAEELILGKGKNETLLQEKEALSRDLAVVQDANQRNADEAATGRLRIAELETLVMELEKVKEPAEVKAPAEAKDQAKEKKGKE